MENNFQKKKQKIIDKGWRTFSRGIKIVIIVIFLIFVGSFFIFDWIGKAKNAWNGEKFIYRADLSTSSKFSKDEESERYLDKVKSLRQRKKQKLDNELVNFQGDWVCKEGDEYWFYLHLDQRGHKVKGWYSAVANDNSDWKMRIDGIPEESENIILGTVKGRIAEVEFKSEWGGMGKAKIIYKGDKIEWLVTEVLQRGYYCPNEAILLRDKKRKTRNE